MPYARDVRDLVSIYGNPARERLDELLELADSGRAQDWYGAYRDVLQGDQMADHLLRYYELERDSAEMKLFEVDLIPGLLQSERYIDAVLTAVAPHYSAKERARYVDFRLKRQDEVLRRTDPPELTVIVSQLAIVRAIGGPVVMNDQVTTLQRELTEGRLKTVDFRILPFEAPARGALGGPFNVLKYGQMEYRDLVYIEGREGATWLESDGEVNRYEGYFSGIEVESLSRDESLAELTRAAERYAREVEVLA